MKRASLKDVATRAGVGLGTASRVINGNRNVKPVTREKVLKAIEELNYRPNNIARSLKINATRSLGVLLTDLKSGFDTEIVRGIESEAGKKNYSIFLTNTNKERSRMISCIENFVEKNVDGIIIIGGEITEEFYADIRQFHIPLITVSCESNIEPEEQYASIAIDNEQAAYEVVEYFIKKKHKRIAMISGEKDEINAGIPRIKGYQRALSKYGISFKKEYLIEGNYTFAAGYEAAKQFLAISERPTAIFAASDAMAIGAEKALLEAGIKIPEEIAVFGFDGLDFAEYVHPSLSTVVQPRYEMGILAMQRMFEFLNGKNNGNSKVIMKHSLAIRESS